MFAGGRTVLVIEDSITIRKLVEMALRGSDAVVEFATSGAEAIAKVRAVSPAVVLMDFVLPDMKGVDICARLADFDGLKPRVLLMSAKMDDVKRLFDPYPFVVDFLAKPFRAPDIAQRITAILNTQPSVGGATDPGVTRAPARRVTSILSAEEREAAAQAIYTAIRSKLAQIPTWAAEGQASSVPASFFAKKLLTSDTVERVFEGLVPIARRYARSTEVFTDDGVLLSGRLGTLSPYELFAIVRRLERTGELVIGERGETIGFFRNGKLMLVTSRLANEWLDGVPLDLSGAPRDVLRKAQNEQAATGKPALVSLAEAGALPPCDLSSLIAERGRHVLHHLLSQLGPGAPFSFRQHPDLPLYVDAYGRGLSFRQVVLERLRTSANADDLPTVAPDVIFERRAGFSKRIAQFELNAHERRALALIDGTTTTAAIADRTGTPLAETIHALRRLEAVELIVRLDTQRRSSEIPLPSRTSPKHVAILEPEVETFQTPLARLLAERTDPYALIPLDDERDVFAALRRAAPSLVILNASAQGIDAAMSTVRAARAADELRNTLFVAVTEASSKEESDMLTQAGFDAVLPKPVSYAAIERLLVT